MTRRVRAVRQACRTFSTPSGPVHCWQARIDGAFAFRAGQYVWFEAPDGVSIPFSIASAPSALPRIDIHYAPLPGHPHAAPMDALIEADAVTLRGPEGRVHPDPAGPGALWLVVYRTGITQALSILDAHHDAGHAHRIRLVWCADDPADRYLDDVLRSRAGVERFTYTAPPPTPPRQLGVELGAPADAAARCVLTGDPAWVHAVTDGLAEAGWAEAAIDSDVFAWAPRESRPSAPVQAADASRPEGSGRSGSGCAS